MTPTLSGHCGTCGAWLEPVESAGVLGSEARAAGKLEVRCPAGHSAHVDVAPVLTAAQADNDAVLREALERRVALTASWPACDTCGGPMLLSVEGQKRHARCGSEADRRRHATRRPPKGGPKGRPPGAWPAERIEQLRVLWVAGASKDVIGRAVGLSPAGIYSQVSELRKQGHAFPERTRGMGSVAVKGKVASGQP